MAVDAVHWPSGAAAGATVRLVINADRPGFGAGSARVVAERVTGEIRQDALEAVKAGDWFNAAGIWYKVEGAPELTVGRTWRMGLRRSASPP